ncbi:hypothetical protein MKW98_005958 [Papaver atlanticum]|uniref:Uncharacterized protein n=1 Tax=Papaver atlanticum TaxID=357466 RepID=A0AAD4TB03_9MAGN|nr:hypothetical protein MKW98_005958 [Papaver atlanticum]
MGEEVETASPEIIIPVAKLHSLVFFSILSCRTKDLTIPCLKTPERSIFYGDTSSKRDPRTYLNNVFSLYDYFRKEFYAPKESQKRAKPEEMVTMHWWRC